MNSRFLYYVIRLYYDACIVPLEIAFTNCTYTSVEGRSILNIVSSFPLQVSGNTYCGLLDATDGIFRDCIRNAKELAASYLENCRFDVCANMAIATSAKSAACRTLEAFSAQCSDLGYGQVDWRTAADCRKFTFYNFVCKISVSTKTI